MEQVQKVKAADLVYSVGMSNRPEFYSGRGAIYGDLDENKLYKIYKEILKKLGDEEANAFVTMVKNIRTLSATNFLNCLYALEKNSWHYEPTIESNIDVGSAKTDDVEFTNVRKSVASYNPNDTEYIRNTFLYKIDSSRKKDLKSGYL